MRVWGVDERFNRDRDAAVGDIAVSKTMFEAAVEMSITLNPPVDTILPLLEQHEQEMALAKRMATSVTDFMEKTMVLAGSRTDQQIVDWLQCHIPASLLREAADMWDDDDISNWEEWGAV